MCAEKLADLNISILCNNVGTAAIGTYTNLSDAEVHGMVSCNVYPLVFLTRQIAIIFKKRFEKNKNNRSLIINTSAMMTHGAPPLGQTYAATKLFNDNFT